MLYILIYIFLSILFYNSQRGDLKMTSKELAWCMMALSLIVGFADMLGGYDRYIYCELFDVGADTLRNKQPYFRDDNPIMGYKTEIVYVAWNYVVAHITNNRYIYILLTTLLVYLLLFKSFKDYINNYPFLLLMFMGMWFFFTFTYLRQVMAASLAWYGYRYVIQRKIWKFLILAFIVFRTHNSGIVFFVLYFIPMRRLPKQWLIYIMVVATFIGLSGYPSSLFDAYGTVTDEQFRIRGYNEEGVFRYEYIIEAWFFLYIIFSRYNRIPNDVKHSVFLNASMMFCIMLLLFCRSSNGGRLGWYFMLGALVIVSELVSYRSHRTDISIIYSVVTILFLRFVFAWGMLISPYKTFLTQGYRVGDGVHAKFEYDDNYDKNKFYRKAFDFKW